MADLDTLRPEVRSALGAMVRADVCRDSVPTDAFDIIRAELLRLASLEKQLRDAYAKQHEALQGWVQRATDAEAELAAALKANRDCVDHFEQMQAELAALKARILPGTTKVEIADTDGPGGDPYGWVGGTLLSHDLIGKRVRLFVEE